MLDRTWEIVTNLQNLVYAHVAHSEPEKINSMLKHYHRCLEKASPHLELFHQLVQHKSKCILMRFYVSHIMPKLCCGRERPYSFPNNCLVHICIQPHSLILNLLLVHPNFPKVRK